MDEHARQTWKVALQTRIQHNKRWYLGLRQLWSLGLTHRQRDAFYVYHHVLYHPACAAASMPDGPTLLAICETLLDDLQAALESLSSPTATWHALGLPDVPLPDGSLSPDEMQALAQERTALAAEITRLKGVLQESHQEETPVTS